MVKTKKRIKKWLVSGIVTLNLLIIIILSQTNDAFPRSKLFFEGMFVGLTCTLAVAGLITLTVRWWNRRKCAVS